MRPQPLVLVSLALLPLIAGCIGGEEPVPNTSPDRDALRAEGTTDLQHLWIPEPAALPDYGADARAWIQHYATTYANRVSFTPVSTMATDYLMAELRALGFDVALRTYHPEAAPVPTEPLGYDVIVATRAGVVEPDHHIGLVAHHDARYSSNEAAYDDGSGTAAVMFLAKHFATVDTRKSITLLLFDGEEMGLRGSCYYVNDVAREQNPRYDIVFGYDMVGMNWPGHDWKMYQMMGDEDDLEILLPLAEHVYRERLGLPEEGVEILTVHDRNSDERRFREAGLPIYRWAGGRHAADYPHYHQPTDTYANMIAYAGSAQNFEAGMQTILSTSIAMLHAADQYAFPEYALTEQDCSFYGPDDGPL